MNASCMSRRYLFYLNVSIGNSRCPCDAGELIELTADYMTWDRVDVTPEIDFIVTQSAKPSTRDGQ